MKPWPYVYLKSDGRWCCDTGTVHGGTRRRLFFQSESDAREQAKDWKKEYGQGGTAATLTDRQRLDAVNALQLFTDRKITGSLYKAVEFYLDAKFPHGGDLTISKALTAFLDEKELDTTLSKVYRYSLNRLERLREGFADIKLSDITGNQLMRYIRDYKSWSPESRRQHYRYFRMFFDWCVRKEHMRANPFADSKQPVGNTADPGVLDVDNVKTLLEKAWEIIVAVEEFGYSNPMREGAHRVQEHRIFPYLVLGLYLGIRPHEITRLRWGDVTPRCEFIRLPSHVSKTADRRTVPVPVAAQVMLQHYIRVMKGNDADMQPEWYILPDVDPHQPGDFAWYKLKFRRWRKLIGLTAWPHDCMRHTFASQFYAAHPNMFELMSRMGHSSSSTTLKHYVQLLDGENWKDFWTLGCTPEVTEEILNAMGTDLKEQKRILLRLPA